jgi:signal transduction histidine kinase
MRHRTRSAKYSGSPVRLHARRVALGATVFALVIYLVACAVADLLVADHLYGSIDARLAVQLSALTKELPRGVSTVTPLKTQVPTGGDDDDLDDAPILAWFVPAGSTSAQRLDSGSPVLPASQLHVDQPIDAHFGGRSFRLDGTAVKNGRIVVATSTQDIGSVRATLLLIEGILAPIVLISLFIAATIIGRRAAAPIERARRRQLEFTADASHELRTPLSVIEAEVGLALNSNRSAAAYRSALERVSGESKRLRRIVDDLLWLARLDSLPANPPHEAVDMDSLARSCAERFDAIAAQKHLTIAVLDRAGPPALVLAPAEWLDRLVSVLLDNACRYANESGRVEISVSSSGARVRLFVDDSGPGIAEDEREHIAQRFHRASAAPGGAGLGLSIADAVVRATNGEWRVAAAPLGGARIEASWTRFQADDGYDESSDETHAPAWPSAPANASSPN